MIFITGASPGTSELRADSSRLRRRSQRVEPGSGQRWRHGEHATTCCGGGPLSERIDDHTMPTYYLILCSGYIRLLYRLYKLIIIIIIYYNIYILYISVACYTSYIPHQASQILNGGDGSKHAGRGCSCLRPAKNSGEGRQT